MVVGGGDSAMEEALFLTKFAKKVYVVHRRDSFRASKIMQDRVMEHEKIHVLWNKEITEIKGDKKVSSVTVRNVIEDSEEDMEETEDKDQDEVKKEENKIRFFHAFLCNLVNLYFIRSACNLFDKLKHTFRSEDPL